MAPDTEGVGQFKVDPPRFEEEMDPIRVDVQGVDDE